MASLFSAPFSSTSPVSGYNVIFNLECPLKLCLAVLSSPSISRRLRCCSQVWPLLCSSSDVLWPLDTACKAKYNQLFEVQYVWDKLVIENFQESRIKSWNLRPRWSLCLTKTLQLCGTENYQITVILHLSSIKVLSTYRRKSLFAHSAKKGGRPRREKAHEKCTRRCKAKTW